MIYNEFKGLKLSALGMGCMRFPVLNEDSAQIDEAAVSEMVSYAFSKGINYFDTAWPYHGGNSETVMGKILSKYPRESFYLATKFPGFEPENLEKVVEIFERQLEKCQVEYFDFYLIHNVTQRNIDMLLDEKYGIFPYLKEQKRLGRIRHLGFSTHGSMEVIQRFLDAYGSEMEFCQIQLNYLDWELQNAKNKVAFLNEHNIPIWVMEPVRGGRLAQLSEEDTLKLKAHRPDASVPEWAFRFLQGVEGVFMTLSGMSNMEQLAENIATYESEKPLTKDEYATLMEISAELVRKNGIPCTGCAYCVSRCPMGLEIPDLLKLYNARAEGSTEEPGFPGPGDCVGCRNCEIVCPQGIMISEVMEDFANKLG